MATVLGAKGRIAFREEATYGSPGAISATTGLRLLYNSYEPDASKRPDPQADDEISGVAIDFQTFEESEVIAGGTLRYLMRYSGIHAALTGFSMGDLVTTGAAAPFTHTATLADTLDSFTLIHQFPVNLAGVDTFRDDNFVGMKVARSTWSHEPRGILVHEIEMIGSYLDHDQTPVALPAQAGGTVTENYVPWHHRDPSVTIQVDAEDAAPIAIVCHSWSVTLDNNIDRRFVIQAGRKTAEPARIGKRSITGRMVLDQDEALDEFLRLFGRLNTDTTKDFTLIITYEDPNVTPLGNHEIEFRVNNCRLISVGRAITGPGEVRPAIEFRAHFNTAAPSDALTFYMKNSTQGPTYVASYGLVVTP